MQISSPPAIIMPESCNKASAIILSAYIVRYCRDRRHGAMLFACNYRPLCLYIHIHTFRIRCSSPVHTFVQYIYGTHWRTTTTTHTDGSSFYMSIWIRVGRRRWSSLRDDEGRAGWDRPVARRRHAGTNPGLYILFSNVRSRIRASWKEWEENEI